MSPSSSTCLGRSCCSAIALRVVQRDRGRIRLGFHVFALSVWNSTDRVFFFSRVVDSSAMSGRQVLVAALRASTRALAFSQAPQQSTPYFVHGGGASRSLLKTEVGSGVRHIRTHTKHKVILTTPIESLGKAGQIVSVAPGYARNRLIPNMLALPAIDKFVLLVQSQIKQVGSAQVEETFEKVESKEETEEEKLTAVEAVLRRLAKGRVVLRRDVGMKTTLLKLVTKTDILEEVKRQLGVELHEDNLILESAFSEVGEYDVLLRLPEGLRLPGDKAKMFLKIRIRRK